ncbi:MAG: IclR family transcriptional regulator C-terminal domain-containing protein [Mycolicibacterium insubricum]|nr:hypothetical protein [Mycobacterium sp.]
MAVKGSSTAARVLTVFEAGAAHQPVGVAAHGAPRRRRRPGPGKRHRPNPVALPQHRPPSRTPRRTPDAAFRAHLDEARARGYAASSEVNAPSMTIAAPVFEPGGHPIGVIAISGPAERMPAAEHPRLAALVCAAAPRLTENLTGQPR